MPAETSTAVPSVNLAMSGKLRLLSLLPEERGGLGFSVLPNAIYRHREALGLDHWSLLVLLAVVSHGRTRSPDFCPAAISVLAKDTGISRATVERTLKRLVTDPGVSIRFGRKSPRSRPGLGLLSLPNTPKTRDGWVAARRAGRRSPKRRIWFWKGGPRRRTNVYCLAPLVARLNDIMNPHKEEKVAA